MSMFGSETASEPQPELPPIPPMNTYKVRRSISLYDSDNKWMGTKDEIVELLGHEAQITQAGNVLMVLEWVRLGSGATKRMVRAFNGWIDWEEILPEYIAPPLIHTDVSGMVIPRGSGIPN